MPLTRRELLGSVAAAGAAALVPRLGMAQGNAKVSVQDASLTRPIPATGEALPLVGLGSWITFNVGDDETARAARAEVIAAFFEDGGRMIDSSPMYGSAQAVIGDCLGRTGNAGNVFATDKVWTGDGADGPNQIAKSLGLWGVDRFDLLQVHNLLAWEDHLETLQAMKEDGRLRYVGITTSHGRRHEDLEEIMRTQPLDFVQLTYNVADRAVEKRLLPLAQDKGIAVIVNRPYRRKELIHRFEGQPLPGWAGDLDAKTWAQVLLKFAISHPAVTCAIPATTQVVHVRENLAAAREPLPDAKMRARMAADIAAL